MRRFGTIVGEGMGDWWRDGFFRINADNMKIFALLLVSAMQAYRPEPIVVERKKYYKRS